MTKDIHNTRVALLIDTDNVPGKYASELFNGDAAYGSVIIRKGYGVLRTDTRSPSENSESPENKGYGVLRPDNNQLWKKEIVFEHAIEPVVRYEYRAGKNITDFALVIDALDLAYRNIVDVICIASNDSDISLVAMKLREVGVKVYGFGTHLAAQAFVSACDQFMYIGPEQDELPKSIMEDPIDSGQILEEKNVAEQQDELNESTQENFVNSAQALGKKNIRKMLEDACDNCHDHDGWAHLGAIGNYLIRINPAFSSKNYGGYKSLTELVESLEEYEINNDNAIKKRK